MYANIFIHLCEGIKCCWELYQLLEKVIEFVVDYYTNLHL